MRSIAKTFVSVCLCALLGLATPATAAVDDNFNDNAQSTQWTLVEDAPSTLWLDETNARLELLASAPASVSDDAIYLSNGPTGFQIKTDSNFDMTLDYSYTGFSGGGGVALVFGIGVDLNGEDSAAIGLLRSDTALFDLGLAAAHRISDAETVDPMGYAGATGTFRITYDATGDVLTLSDDTSGLSWPLASLVQGTWGADKVWVSFGGRGEGLTLTSGEAYLDNFTLHEGVVVNIPEPATLALLTLGGLSILRRRPRQLRRRAP